MGLVFSSEKGESSAYRSHKAREQHVRKLAMQQAAREGRLVVGKSQQGGDKKKEKKSKDNKTQKNDKK